MQALIHGVMLTLAEGKLILLEGNPAVDFLGKGKILHLPVAFVLLLVFGAIMLVIMKRTKLGAYTYALGGNEEALRSSGVNIRRYKLLIYVMAGLCAGIGTILITCRMAAVYSSVSSTLLLDAIAATVIGGTERARRERQCGWNDCRRDDYWRNRKLDDAAERTLQYAQRG